MLENFNHFPNSLGLIVNSQQLAPGFLLQIPHQRPVEIKSPVINAMIVLHKQYILFLINQALLAEINLLQARIHFLILLQICLLHFGHHYFPLNLGVFDAPVQN